MGTRTQRIGLQLVCPDIRGARGPAPCALIGRVLSGKKRGKTVAWNQACQLACLQVRFANALLKDGDLAIPPPPEWGRGRVKLEAGRTDVPIGLLDFPGWAEKSWPLVRPETAGVLAGVSESLARQVLLWAPPVVGLPGRDGRRRVVANVLPTLLATRVLSADQWVKCAVTMTQVRETDLRSITLAIAGGFADFCKAARPIAARTAADMQTAVAVTGLTERQCRTYRSVADEGAET